MFSCYNKISTCFNKTLFHYNDTWACFLIRRENSDSFLVKTDYKNNVQCHLRRSSVQKIWSSQWILVVLLKSISVNFQCLFPFMKQCWYSQFDHQEQTLLKFEWTSKNFHLCFWKCLQNDGHFVQCMLTHLPLVPHICVSESGQHWFR